MKTKFFIHSFILLFFLICFDACKETEVAIEPETNNPSTTKLKKITYSDTDYQLFDYNSEGKIIKYTSQWQFIQNDPSALKKIVYDFQYNEAGKLLQLNISGGFTIKYHYLNGVLDKTEEVDNLGRVQVRRFYTFSNNHLIEERMESNLLTPDAVEYLKTIFEYDAKGNLWKENIFNKSGESYVPYASITYLDFDNQKKADNFLMRYPFLPNVQFQVNNPGKQIFASADGTQLSTEVFTFQYQSNGYPSQRKEQNIGNSSAISLTGFFTYEE